MRALPFYIFLFFIPLEFLLHLLLQEQLQRQLLLLLLQLPQQQELLLQLLGLLGLQLLRSA
jgi:hypothetical protein